MNAAEAFVEKWSKVWRGPDSDPQLCMGLLHEGCPLVNPINQIKREDLPGFMTALLEMEPASGSGPPVGVRPATAY
jgi:hypothetical protein